MAPPATNAKIEELRFRLKTDPKSRLFYPLAEELRKAGQFDEAEQVLRNGLTAHSTYLSAWVSLGRVLRDQKKDSEAVDALLTALQLDPGNVVAARILADAYLSLGDKVEAIKKYKLVHALMPADEDLEAMITTLDRELNAPPPPAEPEPEPESPFDRTMPPFEQAGQVLGQDVREDEATGDAEPMALAHEESPFEEPLSSYTAAAMTVEAPVGMHIGAAPAAAEVPAPVVDEEMPPVESAVIAPEAAPVDEADVFSPTEDIPSVGADANPKIARLENWLSKVTRKEVQGV